MPRTGFGEEKPRERRRCPVGPAKLAAALSSGEGMDGKTSDLGRRHRSCLRRSRAVALDGHGRPSPAPVPLRTQLGYPGVMGETNIPAEEPPQVEEARLPPPDVHSGWAGHHPISQAKGPPQALGLIAPVADRATFAALRRSSRRVRRGPITITYAAGHPTEQVRVAYAVGRRVGGAVRRNRLRRQLRAVMSGLGARLRPGAYQVGAGAGAAALSFAELRERVTEALDNQELLNRPGEELDS